jgi:hypothetical protein
MAARDRDARDEGPTIGARALMNQIRELPYVQSLVGARVEYKWNAKGEHVVAVIYPPQPVKV